MQKIYSSPYKINIGLEILSKRDDGYHNINTVFYKLHEPHDELVVEEAESFRFTTIGHNIPNDDNNIVVKAINLCAETAKVALPKLHIHLRKQIPSGAGLGGGSANAATAINIFSELHQRLSQEEKKQIAKKLGADVPFFLEKSEALSAVGIGEILSPVQLHISHPILIVKLKDAFISTVKAYSMLRIKNREKQTDYGEVFRNMPEPSGWRDHIVNDFEEVAFAMHPVLFSLKQGLYKSGAEFALMSGSGSALFAIYADKVTAQSAHEKLLRDYPDSTVFLSLQ